MSVQGECFLCEPPSPIALEELPAHLLDVHGLDMSDGLLRWPDGSPVVFDQTLAPGDFA